MQLIREKLSLSMALSLNVGDEYRLRSAKFEGGHASASIVHNVIRG